jgi:hypothetical protein
MTSRKKPYDKIDHIKDCGAVELYKIVDPSDMVARFFKCNKHDVIDFMFPVQMAVVWPDGKSEMWWDPNGIQS